MNLVTSWIGLVKGRVGVEVEAEKNYCGVFVIGDARSSSGVQVSDIRKEKGVFASEVLLKMSNY